MTRLRGRITELDDEGRGLIHHEGLIVHVPGGLPGEQAAVEIEHRSPHRAEAWARLIGVEHPSAERRPPCCPATGRCGGCPLGVLSYEAQLAHKEARLAQAIAALTDAPRPEPIVPSDRPLGYRSLSKLVYGRVDGRPALGAYAARSHALVDLAGCNVAEPILETVRALLLEAFVAAGVEPYDEATRAGLLAYVVLRANVRGEVLVTLVGADLDRLAEVATGLPAHPAIVGVAGNRRPTGNAIFGAETRSLRGAAELEETVGATTVLLSPTAFFQVNRAIAARLYADLADALAVGSAGAIVDAYAGVGGIALTLAERGATKVTGVEVNAAAVRDAERAAARAGLAVTFLAADASAGLRACAAAGPVDTLVVNPPRRGLDEAMRQAIGEARPQQLAYVSCDPDTLARDLAILANQGLRLRHLRAYDMHPQTAHIETLAILTREGAPR